MTNRSAKGGARSSPHYGGEGVLIHPPHQGVCGRHGTEDLCVTPGELVRSPGGIGERDPISREAKWESMLCEQSDRCMVLEARRKPCDREIGSPSGLGKATGESSWQRLKSKMSKVGDEDNFHE